MRLTLLVLLVACSPTSIGGDAGSDTDDARSTDTSSQDTRPGDAASDEDSAAAGDAEVDGFVASEGRDEVCGNAVDDDGDGRIDNGCECTPGTVRPCWLGPLDARSIGNCQDGQQACEPEGAVANWGLCIDQQLPESEYRPNGSDDDCDGEIDEAGGLCLSSAQMETGACGNGRDDDCDTRVDCDDPDCAMDPACSPTCQPTETLCWGEQDDDCDGDFDCDDADCAGNTSCTAEACDGAVYERRDLGTRPGSSGISAGDGEPVTTVTCGESRCVQGQVEVRVGVASLCVPPPSACPANTYPSYVNGEWRCEAPCEVIVQYGYIYGFERRCAPRPPGPCPEGQVQTFVEGQEQWECRTTCNNGQYDRVVLDGQLVCVPC